MSFGRTTTALAAGQAATPRTAPRAGLAEGNRVLLPRRGAAAGEGGGMRRAGRRGVRAALVLLALAGGGSLAAPAAAQTGRFGSPGVPNIGPPEAALFPDLAALQDRLEEQGWIIRGQATFILQGHPRFRSPYQAGGSLHPAPNARNTFSADLILGRALWEGAEIIFNPSVTRGFGLSNSVGIAAFPNNEAFRLGSTPPVAWIPRLFLRQTIALSAETGPPDNDPLRFTRPLPTERITITLGRFSVWDIFDDNRYAHDARTQFLNWALVGGAAFDYAADARGFTNGATFEWENGRWAVRLGAFQVAREVNSLPLDPSPFAAWQILASLERFWQINGREGAVRLIYGASRTRQSSWGELLAGGSFEANPTRRRLKHNIAVSFDQEMGPDWGVFGRFSWNDGRTQNWMFTEMDLAFSGGVAIQGQRWGRPEDTLGLGFNVGFASEGRRRYLAQGGIGFITGDGKLRYRPEWVTEAYYDIRLAAGLNMALNYQLAVNPGYNADRGPVHLFALRLRTAF
ncbi:MAG: carbohydrate porin [Rhodovarius sp.]|nr:carbohydrate porin [Rhodovarius sp.]